MRLVGIHYQRSVHEKPHGIVRGHIEDVLSAPAGFQRSLVAYAEVIFRYARCRRPLPVKVQALFLREGDWLSFQAGIVIEFAGKALRKKLLITGKDRFRDNGAARSRPAEPGHEVTGKVGAGIALVAHTAFVGDPALHLIHSRKDVEEVLELAAGVVHHKAGLVGSRIGEPEHPGTGHAGKFRLDPGGQLYAVVVGRSLFPRMGIGRCTLMRPHGILSHRRRKGKRSVVRHGGAIGIMAGPEALDGRMVGEIAAVGLGRLGRELHHGVRVAHAGIHESHGFLGSRKRGLSFPHLRADTRIHIVHRLFLTGRSMTEGEGDHARHQKRHAAGHFREGLPGGSFPFSHQETGHAAGEDGCRLHDGPAHGGGVIPHLITAHAVEEDAAIPDDAGQGGPEVVFERRALVESTGFLISQ